MYCTFNVMVLEKNPVGHSKDCDLTFLNITGLYI